MQGTSATTAEIAELQKALLEARALSSQTLDMRIQKDVSREQGTRADNEMSHRFTAVKRKTLHLAFSFLVNIYFLAEFSAQRTVCFHFKKIGMKAIKWVGLFCKEVDISIEQIYLQVQSQVSLQICIVTVTCNK